MANVTKEQNTTKTAANSAARTQGAHNDSPRSAAGDSDHGAANGRERNRRPNRSGRGERVRSEYDQRIVSIRRVTRVVSGGRRFSFSVSMVIGNRNGQVGVGTGKAADTALAIEKAVRAARKHLVAVPLGENHTIPHVLRAKYNASVVELRPGTGRGLVAGSSVRDVLELVGLTNISAKLHSRSKNKLNNARAAIKALAEISKPAVAKPEHTTARR